MKKTLFIAMLPLLYSAQGLAGYVGCPPEMDKPLLASGEVNPTYLFSALKIARGMESDVLDLVNVERSKAGIAPLHDSLRLAASARAHAKDMVEKNYYSHDSLDGTDFASRIWAANYPRSIVGENIYESPMSAEEAVRGWMASPSHRENILNPSFKQMGVGFWCAASAQWTTRWVQDFGGDDSGF